MLFLLRVARQQGYLTLGFGYTKTTQVEQTNFSCLWVISCLTLGPLVHPPSRQMTDIILKTKALRRINMLSLMLQCVFQGLYIMILFDNFTKKCVFTEKASWAAYNRAECRKIYICKHQRLS